MLARSLVCIASISSFALLAQGCFLTADDTIANANDDAGADAGIRDSSVLDSSKEPDADAAVGPGVVLFAGDGPSIFDDTWQLFGSDWKEAATSASAAAVPPERYQHRLASLPGGRVLLFGGVVGGTYYDDTWSFDGKSWTKSAAKGPSARSDHAMTAFGTGVLLYGGDAPNGTVTDTWIFDGTDWTQVSTDAGAGSNPGMRIGAAIATLNGKAYLFGGVGADASTWSFDGAGWTKIATTGPSERCFMQMATIGNAIYLFGGEEDANHIQDDTWKLDGTTWTKLAVTGPSARFQYGMTSFQSKIVLFGGDAPIGAGDPFLGDTWSFDGSAWTAITTNAGPGGRYPYTLAAREF